MSVTVTSTQGPAYPWSTSAFAWDSAEGGKAWADAAATSFLASDMDVVGLSPREARLPVASRVEGFVFGDARRAIAIASRVEAMGFAETYIDLIAFVLKVAESIAIAAVAPKQMLPTPALEAFGIGGIADRWALRAVAQAFGIIDGRLGVAQRTTQEAVSLAALAERLTSKPNLSSLGITEERGAIALPNARQALALTDTYIDLIAFIVQVVEQLSLADRRASAPAHRSAEQFLLLDRLLRASDAVIADLAFRATPLDEAGFLALVTESRPLGFAAFRELTPGDYEYAKALVRLVLESPVTSANRIALSDAQLNIDVPDVRDRGAVAVPVGGIVVPFARSFNAPPEVQATFKGGAVLAIPQIGTMTAASFQLSLIDPDTLASVAGNASWSAEGY